MKKVNRDDVTIAYRDEGEGPAVLLLHGHTLDGRVFDGLASALTERGFRTIRPDLRGHGRSSRPPQGYHWSHHCADILAVLDDAEVPRAAVVGFSLGGGVALEMAITVPERVDSLCLIDPVMPDRPFEDEFMMNLKEVAKTARVEGIRAAMEGPWMRSPLFAASFERPGIKEKAAVIVRDFPGAEYLAEARDQSIVTGLCRSASTRSRRRRSLWWGPGICPASGPLPKKLPAVFPAPASISSRAAAISYPSRRRGRCLSRFCGILGCSPRR